MMKVWYSNKLSPLVDCFLEQNDASLPAFPERAFTITQLVVPNRNIESFLKFEIARRQGIAANFEFCFLEEFLESATSSPDSRRRLLRRSELRSRLLHLLHRDHTDRLPAKIREYIERGPNENARDRRRFELANELARLFESYGFSRKEMLQAWDQGAACFEHLPEAAETEQWQREIWSALFGSDAVLPTAQDQAGPLAVPLHRFEEAMAPGDGQSRQAVHLFGFSYLARTCQEILARIGESVDVNLYVFLPVFDRSEFGGGPPATETIFSTWAKPCIENLQLLRRIPSCETIPMSDADARPATLLHHLQEHIRNQTTPGSGTALEPDDSVQVLACPSVEREVEIIGNAIWSMIHDSDRDPSTPPLRFHEIAVIVADRKRLDAYQAHFRNRFAALFDIPCNFADVSLAKQSSFLQSVLALLELPLSGWKRAEVLKVLLHPCLQARFRGADGETWKRWVSELGVYFGADQQSLAGTYITKDVYNWDQALTRLVLGSFLGGRQLGVERTFAFGDKCYVPEDVAPGDADPAALLVAVARSLMADAAFARDARLTFTQWSAFLRQFITTYLAPASDEDEKSLNVCLRRIFRLRDNDLAGATVSYETAAQILREGIASLTGSEGHFLADGVVISSFLPMRPIPFRVAFIAGLGECCFPAQDPDSSLDLRLVQPQPGDVSSRQRDEYLFLETLASTTERVVFSYVSRDPHTGDALKPSSALDGLLYTLEKDFGVDDARRRLTISFPLHRFDQPVAGESGAFPLYDPAAREEQKVKQLRQSIVDGGGEPKRIAAALRSLPEPLRHLLSVVDVPSNHGASQVGRGKLIGILAGSQGASVVPMSLSIIRRFLECPLSAWAELQLRLRNEEEDADLAAVDSEPFEFSPLEHAMLLRDLFWSTLEMDPREVEEFYDRRMQFRELAEPCPTGVFLGVQKAQHLETLANWKDNLRNLGGSPLTEFKTMRFGRAEEFLGVDELRPAIRIPLDPSSNSPVVELYGKSEPLHLESAISVTLIRREKPSDFDFLRGFVDYVALAAAGICEGRPYTAVVAPSEPASDPMMTRTWPALDRAQAVEFLRTVLCELLLNKHAYLLPREAVQKARKEPTQSIAEIVHQMKTDKRPTYRSLYGPVPKPWTYDAPPEEEAARMIETRWKLFFAGCADDQ